MESHRLSSSPDIRMQRSYMRQQTSRGSQDNLFGVRVQVQGIKGQPYVVLNSPGQESNRDISVITHQAGYNPGMARRSVNERHSSCESQRTVPASVFHYQKHPEILKPYDPKSNNLNLVVPSQTASVGEIHTSHFPETSQTANVTKPRVPLPAEGPQEDLGEVAQLKAPPLGGTVRSPNLVDTDSILSVGKLISQFNSSQRRGRGGPRNRLDPEQCRRSRSVDSGRTSDSSSSSPSSSRDLSLKGNKMEAAGGMYPPGSARARLLGGEATLSNKKDQSKTSTGHTGKEMFSPQATKLLHTAEKTSISRSCSEQTEESDDRDTQVMTFSLEHSYRLKAVLLSCMFSNQVTPDLLKGQQELSADPIEETAKQTLLTYLKEGYVSLDFRILS